MIDPGNHLNAYCFFGFTNKLKEMRSMNEIRRSVAGKKNAKGIFIPKNTPARKAGITRMIPV
jgi:hypothetical protein